MRQIVDNPKIAVSAGELSGDQHLSHVVRELKSRIPGAQVRGMGGRYLRAQGVDTIVDSEKSAGVMGFVEVLAKLPGVLESRKKMITLLKEWRPDLLIVCDYPDFNIRIARVAKELGIKVLYFIPPKVWVWRQGRTKLLKQYTDAISCIFPHERQFLRDHDVPQAVFVGHPFSGNDQFRIPPSVSKKELFDRINLDPAKPTLLFLPGSRIFEVRRHIAIALAGLEMVKQDIPSLQCIMSHAPTISDSLMDSLVGKREWVRVLKTPALDLMKMCDAGVIKSGTSTLEAAFTGIPFVCIYKAPAVSAFILRCFADLKTVSLPNLVLPDSIKEIIQGGCTPEAIAAEVPALLSPQGRERLRRNLQKVVECLSGHDPVEGFSEVPSAYARTALMCEKLLPSL